MDLRVGDATEADAAAIAVLRTAAAEDLTRRYGYGHWSSAVSEPSVRRGMRGTRILVARDGDRILGTLALATRKPWTIDAACFTAVRTPLYLTDMAVAPGAQRRGVGRHLLVEAVALARAMPADAIRLDAYDSDAGAGPFYAKCGFRETGRVLYRSTPLIYFELVL
jgi:ribosomal protein S18 acetylase RimI-like enzyme